MENGTKTLLAGLMTAVALTLAGCQGDGGDNSNNQTSSHGAVVPASTGKSGSGDSDANAPHGGVGHSAGGGEATGG